MEIPVYLFTGFLESGKTSFIQETLEDSGFNNGDSILLLVCEEGEREYDESAFASKNVHIEYLEDKSEVNPKNLEELRANCKAQRVLVEYNGMWLIDEFFQNLPENWVVYQEMTFADANTYESYNANMRSLVADKLKSCELCAFNRAKSGFDKLALHRIVRSINRRTDIAYEYADGGVEYDDIEDPLPFDKNAPVIEISDEDFGLWYRDFAENTADYIGKTVKIRALVTRNKLIDAKKEIVVGREIMTCCEADIAYKGLLCRTNRALEFSKGDWVELTAKISMEKHRVYKNDKGPVLTASDIEKSEEPEQPVASFF